jgi:hypothetical protein
VKAAQNQFTHRLPGPQRVADLELVGNVIANQSLRLALLLRAERAACAFGEISMTDRHRRPTAALICLGAAQQV